ncbi:MAG TPA: hypothetical protein VFD13_06990 [Candidatus Kapabacteria bacterium]|nr:hypothetical protein [Candidatus Kapabacteria bacterium]
MIKFCLFVGVFIFFGCSATSTAPSVGPGSQATAFTQKIVGTWMAIPSGGNTRDTGSILIIGPTTIDYLGRGASMASFRWKDGILFNTNADTGAGNYLYAEHDDSTHLPAYKVNFSTAAEDGYYSPNSESVRIDSNGETMALLAHDSLIASSTLNGSQKYPSWLFVRIPDRPLTQPVTVDTAGFHAMRGQWVAFDYNTRDLPTGLTLSVPDTAFSSPSLYYFATSSPATLTVSDTSHPGKLIMSSYVDSVYQVHDTNFVLHLLSAAPNGAIPNGEFASTDTTLFLAYITNERSDGQIGDTLFAIYERNTNNLDQSQLLLIRKK